MPITDHFGNFVPDLEKYKALQKFSVYEHGNQEDCIFRGVILFLKLKEL